MRTTADMTLHVDHRLFPCEKCTHGVPGGWLHGHVPADVVQMLQRLELQSADFQKKVLEYMSDSSSHTIDANDVTCDDVSETDQALCYTAIRRCCCCLDLFF